MQHLVVGYETSKAVAVERALEVAGADAESVAARYATEYHRQISRKRNAARHASRGASAPKLGALEFLFHYV